MGAISEMSDMSKPSPFQVVETAAIQLTINQNKAPSTHMFLIWVYLSAHVIFFKLDQIRRKLRQVYKCKTHTGTLETLSFLAETLPHSLLNKPFSCCKYHMNVYRCTKILHINNLTQAILAYHCDITSLLFLMTTALIYKYLELCLLLNKLLFN